jgi:aminopeptidase N
MRRVILLAVILCISFSALGFSDQPTTSARTIPTFYKQEQTQVENWLTKSSRVSPLQEAIDIQYYGLDLVPNMDQSLLTGKVTIRAICLVPSLDSLEFHFWGKMVVHKVYMEGVPDTPVAFNHENHRVFIALPKQFQAGELISIIIEYSGQPNNRARTGMEFDVYEGIPMVWTFSQPYGARMWWPCKDDPSDKADSVDIFVTVPDPYVVASNGTLRQKTSSEGKTIYWWHENYPIATYLVSLAIYPYDVNYQNYIYNNGQDTMSIHYYSFPGNYEKYAAENAVLPKMLRFFSELLGEYPFIEEKYGQADVVYLIGMENQTISSLGEWNEEYYAHELAHQWCGNLIGVAPWDHIWLNEGLAMYLAGAWLENSQGDEVADSYWEGLAYHGPGTVIVEDPWTDLFNWNLTYAKAAWVFRMLHHVLGENDFLAVMKTWFNNESLRYGTVATEDFQTACEDVSGIQLDQFFQQWIYGEYVPEYSFDWKWVSSGNQYEVTVTVEQNQVTDPFWMPLPLTFVLAEGDTTVIVWDSLRTQSFVLMLSDEPQELMFDRDYWILSEHSQLGTESESTQTPSKYDMVQNYPNPFNPSTTISYDLPEQSEVSLTVYDLKGREVTTLQNQPQPAGHYEVQWNGVNDSGDPISTGVYFARLQVGDYSKTIKMVYLK